MFQLTLFVLTAVSTGTIGYLIKVPTSPWQPQQTVSVQKQEWVYIQKRMMPLFENVCEDSTDLLIKNLSNEFANDYGNGNYVNLEIIATLKNYKTSKGFLPKGEIFTEFNQDHVNELKLIYEVLYFAKDFETFYKAASWARQNINCGIYVDAIYLAILNRKDTEKLTIPPPYEIIPNYFINKDAIMKGSLLLTNEELYDTENVREQGNSYIVDADYSTGAYEMNQESLAYFNEDIGLNSFYFLQKLNMLPWLNVSTGLQPRYGEYLYHTMKQLATRYNLERYSNGLPELENINWDSISTVPYNPMLIYSNGNDFAQTNFTVSLDNEDLTILRNIQNNIVTVTTHMRERGYSKEEILNHLMEILVTGNKSYQNLAYKLLGNDFTSGQRLPSVLAHYLTTVRDPVFWKINNQIVELVDCALGVLPGYSRSDLIFPGVEIVNVDIKKMSTSFEYFEFDVTDALKTSTSNTKFLLKFGQYRLNHKPFSIKLNVTSLVTQKGFAKLFISPKVLPGELGQMKNLFFLLDSFEINLKRGKNMITRTSDEMKLSADLTSLRIIRKQIEAAEFGLNALPLKMLDSQSGFPSRLVLPKGSENGLPFQIFVFIAPYIKPAINGRIANIEYNTDAMLNPGYPLDLNNDMHQLLDLPNSIIKDVVISHKVENKPMKEMSDLADSTNSWTSSEIDKQMGTANQAGRPNLRATKQSFDYKSKRGQYGKKDDYLSRRTNYNENKQVIPTTSTADYKNIIENNNLLDKEVSKNNFIPSDEDVRETTYNINYVETTTTDSGIEYIINTSSEINKPIRILKLSARPAFTMKKEPFDYKSKRGQYGKKDDYSANRGNYSKDKQTDFNVLVADNITDVTVNTVANDVEVKVEKDLRTIVNDIDKTVHILDLDTTIFENTIKELEKSDSLQQPKNTVKEGHSYDNIETIVMTKPKQRNPTVYEYLFNNPLDKYDSIEEKVYE